MRQLPYADPGVPDTRSPVRMMQWIARGQLGVMALTAGYGVVWMVSRALMPFVIGRGIDAILDDSVETAWRWAAALVGLGVIQAVFGALRHRSAVANFLYSAIRIIQIVTRHSARTGPNLTREKATGEVAATVSSDAAHIGHAFEVLGRFAGAIVTYLVVAIIVLTTSTPLGLMVLIGVPLLIVLTIPLVKPIQERQREQRQAVGNLTELGADTVAGLRVLRGIGGEAVFAHRYRERSEQVRSTGVTLARSIALLDALMVLLPGVFLVLLTWAGARMVLDGSLAAGALVSMYGYAFFLLIPVRTVGEMAFVTTRALVACRRVIDVLSIGRDVPIRAQNVDDNDPPKVDWTSTTLSDPRSGVRVEPGRITMLVADDPAVTTAVADRLGRMTTDGEAEADCIALSAFPTSTIREHVIVSDPEPTLFTGSLRSELDPTGRHDDPTLLAAMAAAAADDVMDTLPDGLDSQVEERGRSFSGGQRQRIALARVLVTDPDILILVEPTSAVDAHTEAAVAANLVDVRAGRTTVVITESPLVLARADQVVFLADGRVAATGTHDHLLATEPRYRYTVTREEVTTA